MAGEAILAEYLRLARDDEIFGDRLAERGADRGKPRPAELARRRDRNEFVDQIRFRELFGERGPPSHMTPVIPLAPSSRRASPRSTRPTLS